MSSQSRLSNSRALSSAQISRGSAPDLRQALMSAWARSKSPLGKVRLDPQDVAPAAAANSKSSLELIARIAGAEGGEQRVVASPGRVGLIAASASAA